jgi:hypothetical protein
MVEYSTEGSTRFFIDRDRGKLFLHSQPPGAKQIQISERDLPLRVEDFPDSQDGLMNLSAWTVAWLALRTFQPETAAALKEDALLPLSRVALLAGPTP